MLEKIQNQINSGKDKIVIHNFRGDCIELVNFLKDCLINPSCPIKNLYFNATFLENNCLRILMSGLKENNSITELTLANIFHDSNINQSLEYINNMLKKNKSITYLCLRNCNIEDNISILIPGLKKSNIISLNLEQNNLKTKGVENLKNLIEDSSCILENLNLSENQIPKTTLEKKLLPSIRKNITLFFVDIYHNIYSEEIEKKIEEKIKEETDINKEIQKLWKQFSQRKSGFYTKEQENYLNRRPYRITNDNSKLPLQLRFLIQEYIPRDIKNNIELFIRWIMEKRGVDEYDDIVQKLIKYERSL